MSLDVSGPHDGPYRWTIVVPEQRADLELDAEIRHALDRMDDADTVQLWIREVDAVADAVRSSSLDLSGG